MSKSKTYIMAKCGELKEGFLKLLIIVIIVLLIVSTGQALEPDEILEDQKLELRARELSKDLRCVVCTNESIDESNSMIAKDLRILLRERLVAGDTDEEIIDFLVGRYGEYILLKPVLDKKNIILWLIGPFIFVISLLSLTIAFLRKRALARKSNIIQNSN